MKEGDRISFWVSGRPVPKGNLQAFCPNSRRSVPRFPCHPIVTTQKRQAGPLKEWVEAIVRESRTHISGDAYLGPVWVAALFYFARPKSNHDDWPMSGLQGDIDKLYRAVLDALQAKANYGGAVISDDRQVVAGSHARRWCNPDRPQPGALIRIVCLGTEGDVERLG